MCTQWQPLRCVHCEDFQNTEASLTDTHTLIVDGCSPVLLPTMCRDVDHSAQTAALSSQLTTCVSRLDCRQHPGYAEDEQQRRDIKSQNFVWTIILTSIWMFPRVNFETRDAILNYLEADKGLCCGVRMYVWTGCARAWRAVWHTARTGCILGGGSRPITTLNVECEECHPTNHRAGFSPPRDWKATRKIINEFFSQPVCAGWEREPAVECMGAGFSGNLWMAK